MDYPVFISTDHEYRGEESLPALARILAKRYGFKCTVIWALDENMVPIPGFRNVAQVTENAGALELGPLSQEQVSEVQKIISEIELE